MAVLYIISSPIGNLSDISLRALEILKETDIVVCEDSRITNRLLSRYNIKKPLYSIHQHSSAREYRKVISKIAESNTCAYLSDAGTPGLQDPGPQLIEQVLKLYPDTKITPVPGPSAVTAILSISHFRVDSFLFLGYLPKKKGKEKTIKEILSSRVPVVFFESSHRILKTLMLIYELAEDKDKRNIIIGKDLTKLREDVFRGSVKEAFEYYKNHKSIKGEYVLLIEGKKK